MQGRSTLVIVWSVLVVSQVIYLIVPALRTLPNTEENMAFLPVFAGCLGVVAFLQAVGVAICFRRGVVSAVADGRLDVQGSSGAGRLFTVLMICWVLAESIAIYALVLRFLGAPLPLWGPFPIVAAALFLYVRPWHPALSSEPTSQERAQSGRPLS